MSYCPTIRLREINLLAINAHLFRKDPFHHRLRIAAKSRMHRAGLQHGAGGGGDPVPALAETEFRDRAGVSVTGADAGDQFQRIAEGVALISC